jgi:Xaa-Pro aminopeptidase
VVFDYGAELNGYCSDITRTLVVNGEPTHRHRELYNAVLRAQLAALDAIKPGLEGKAD